MFHVLVGGRKQIILTYCFDIGEKDYYERQLATLKSFEEVDSLGTSDCIDEEDGEEQAQQERAMKISNYANIVLLILKVVYVSISLEDFIILDEQFQCCRLAISTTSIKHL